MYNVVDLACSRSAKVIMPEECWMSLRLKPEAAAVELSS
jgi:hypothetical protein